MLLWCDICRVLDQTHHIHPASHLDAFEVSLKVLAYSRLHSLHGCLKAPVIVVSFILGARPSQVMLVQAPDEEVVNLRDPPAHRESAAPQLVAAVSGSMPTPAQSAALTAVSCSVSTPAQTAAKSEEKSPSGVKTSDSGKGRHKPSMLVRVSEFWVRSKKLSWKCLCRRAILATGH